MDVKYCDWSTLNEVSGSGSLFQATAKKTYGEEDRQIGSLTFVNSESAFPGQSSSVGEPVW